MLGYLQTLPAGSMWSVMRPDVPEDLAVEALQFVHQLEFFKRDRLMKNVLHLCDLIELLRGLRGRDEQPQL